MAIKQNQSSDRSAVVHAAIDPLLTAREGAALLRISEPTFWRWVANSTLPKPVKLGGTSRWPHSELLSVIEAAKRRRDT